MKAFGKHDILSDTIWEIDAIPSNFLKINQSIPIKVGPLVERMSLSSKQSVWSGPHTTDGTPQMVVKSKGNGTPKISGNFRSMWPEFSRV